MNHVNHPKHSKTHSNKDTGASSLHEVVAASCHGLRSTAPRVSDKAISDRLKDYKEKKLTLTDQELAAYDPKKFYDAASGKTFGKGLGKNTDGSLTRDYPYDKKQIPLYKYQIEIAKAAGLDLGQNPSAVTQKEALVLAYNASTAKGATSDNAGARFLALLDKIVRPNDHDAYVNPEKHNAFVGGASNFCRCPVATRSADGAHVAEDTGSSSWCCAGQAEKVVIPVKPDVPVKPDTPVSFIPSTIDVPTVATATVNESVMPRDLTEGPTITVRSGQNKTASSVYTQTGKPGFLIPVVLGSGSGGGKIGGVVPNPMPFCDPVIEGPAIALPK